MNNTRALWLVVWILGLTVHAYAQDAVSSPSSSEQAPASAEPAEVPPPLPADVPVSQVPEPPAAYAGTPTSVATATPQWRSGVDDNHDPSARRLFNIWLGLGIGDALGCGNEDPESPCAVDFAGTFALAADYRFVPNFSVGLEIGAWGFAVSDGWRGELPGEPDQAEIGLGYLAVFGRWYWFDQGIVDPYVQLGLGAGSLTATVENADNKYRYSASGVVPHLGMGVDFHVHPAVRLGPQLLAALLLGNEICEQANNDKEVCREPEKNAAGDKEEGNALAWRFMLVGTVMLGER